MTEGGKTLLRFDNFPDHPEVDRHHYQTPGGVYDDIDYTSLREHVQAFYDAMDDHRTR